MSENQGFTKPRNDRIARDMASELVALAAFVRANPDLAPELRWSLKLLVPVSFKPDPRGLLTAFVRAGKASGLTVAKDFHTEHATVLLHIGDYVTVQVYANREQVCERVVLASVEVEKEVPDPAAPKVTVTEVEETVEWHCVPLLAELPDKEAAL